MIKTAKLVGLAVTTLGAFAIAPNAFARQGADDPAGHVRQESRQADRATEVRREDRRADRANEVRHGADDPAGHVRGEHGSDDPAGHE